ncbi:MAG: DinB family protein [Spirochaetes bacterium]|nr:DinB family protein [Spirochaetota bacterium]
MKYQQLLNTYAGGVEALDSKLRGLTGREYDYRPHRDDAWTIKEHIIHLVDSEVNGFIRCKSIIAQPGSECYVMDEDVWTKNIRRKDEDIYKYIRLFGLVRTIVCDLVKDEPEENWRGDYFIRKYKGETVQVTLEKCIEIYCNHLQFHLEYIDAILAELG